MVSAGMFHTMLLRSDGKVTIGGASRYGACHLDGDVRRHYKQVSAGGKHTLLLTREGRIVASGCNTYGQCEPAHLEADLEYIQISAGALHSVALRSDGRAVYAGKRHGAPADTSFNAHSSEPQYLIAKPAEGCYAQVSAGMHHTAILRSDGTVIAFGSNAAGQCSLPAGTGTEPSGRSNISRPGYVQVSAGGEHTVLLSADGSAEAVGTNRHNQCDIPSRGSDWRYVRVSAGHRHTLLLRSDGQVDAVGWNKHGQCDIPVLEDGLVYLQASAGAYQSALLRSDGQAIIIGADYGRCDIPAVLKHQSWADWILTKPRLPQGVEYVTDFSELPVGPIDVPGTPGSNSILTVQVEVEVVEGSCHVTCYSMAGSVVASFEVAADAMVRDVSSIILDKLGRWHWSLQAVLPSGCLLKQFRSHEDFLTVAGTGKVDRSKSSWLAGLTSVWAKEECSEKGAEALASSGDVADIQQHTWLGSLVSAWSQEDHTQTTA